MRKLRRCLFSAAVLVAATLLIGCGKKTLTKSDRFPVRGKITYKGEPARYVMVVFHPESGKGAEAKGQTDDEGNFELRTYSNTDENDGAVPGEYTVTIESFDPVRSLKRPPAGATPTVIAAGEGKAPDTYEIKEEDNNLTIDIP